jgi:hypothetical protein
LAFLVGKKEGEMNAIRIMMVILTLILTFVIMAINPFFVLAEDVSGPIPVLITGQTTSYVPGDDGDLQLSKPMAPNYHNYFLQNYRQPLSKIVW